MTIGTYSDAAIEILAELVRKNGTIGDDTAPGHGRPIAKLTMVDMFAAATLLVPGAINAITRISTGYLGVPILAERFVDGTRPVLGRFIDAGSSGEFNPDGTDIGTTPRSYLAGWPVDGDGARRTLVPPYDGKRGIVYVVSRTDEPESVNFLRSTMRAWERLIVAIRIAIVTYGDDPIGRDESIEFQRALLNLATSLDVCGEIVYPTLAQEIRAALKHALSESGDALVEAAKVGGDLAARAVNTANEITAGGIEAFLRAAGPATLAVAGVVIYIAARRYGWI